MPPVEQGLHGRTLSKDFVTLRSKLLSPMKSKEMPIQKQLNLFSLYKAVQPFPNETYPIHLL